MSAALSLFIFIATTFVFRYLFTEIYDWTAFLVKRTMSPLHPTPDGSVKNTKGSMAILTSLGQSRERGRCRLLRLSHAYTCFCFFSTEIFGGIIRRPFPIWPTGFSNWPTRVPGPVSTGRYLDTIQICECHDCRSTVRVPVDLLYRHRVAPAVLNLVQAYSTET